MLEAVWQLRWQKKQHNIKLLEDWVGLEGKYG